MFCPKTGKVLVQKCSRNLYEINRENSKENLTVVFTFSAKGDVTPPMILYPYKRIPTVIIESVSPDWGWGIGHSEKGCMNSYIFVNYIKNVLYPYLIEKAIEFSLVLFVDGHKSHLSRQASEFCTSLKIILICLYPNATRIVQPANVSTFKPHGWKSAVLEFQRKYLRSKIDKTNVAPILKTVLDEHINPNIIINGFRDCGIFPFNENAID